MTKQLQTRQDKIKFLKDLEQGKVSINEVIRPITGMIIIHNGEVIADIAAQDLNRMSVKKDCPSPKAFKQ